MRSPSWSMVLSVVISATACSSGGDTEDYSHAPLPDAYAASQTSCAGQATPPSFEAWAGAADAIVVGTVTRVDPLFEPAVVTRSNADPPYVDQEGPSK